MSKEEGEYRRLALIGIDIAHDSEKLLPKIEEIVSILSKEFPTLSFDYTTKDPQYSKEQMISKKDRQGNFWSEQVSESSFPVIQIRGEIHPCSWAHTEAEGKKEVERKLGELLTGRKIPFNFF